MKNSFSDFLSRAFKYVVTSVPFFQGQRQMIDLSKIKRRLTPGQSQEFEKAFDQSFEAAQRGECNNAFMETSEKLGIDIHSRQMSAAITAIWDMQEAAQRYATKSKESTPSPH